MGQTAVKVDVNEKYAEQYADYLRTKTDREGKIKGLTLQIEQAEREIDDARIRISDDAGICPGCESYAVVPRTEKSKLDPRADKVIYECGVCNKVTGMRISRADICPKCHNKSMVFIARTAYSSTISKCEHCEHGEEYE